MNVMKSFFQPVESSSQVPNSSQNTLTSYVADNRVTDAEIKWVLKCVQSHYSFKSCDGIARLFSSMFPDSEVAKKFSCGERKAAYLCQFGISQHFKMLLFKCFDEVDSYTLLFDETLNQSNQKKQLDVHIRFWHTQERKVQTRYLTSAFIGHSTAEDILTAFNDATQNLDLSKLLQISMDGPAVNWKFYDLLQVELNKEYGHMCINIGTCGLHILNNAFKRGVETTDWNLTSILSSLYWLFKDSPARREDFLELSQTKKLPVKFCNHRWLENIPAAERAIMIWEDVLTYVRNVERGTLPKVSSKSFAVVAEATKDNSILVKLNFFLSFAKVLKPFLELYQSDNPLLPFFDSDNFKMIKQCLQLFNVLKPESLKIVSTSIEKLCEFDFSSQSSRSSKEKVSLGFIADKLLREAVSCKKMTDKDALFLKYEAQRCVLTMIDSLMNKNPMNFALVRSVSCIDPKLMASKPETCKSKMKKVMYQFTKKKFLPDEDADEVLIQYSDFLENVAKSAQLDFLNFDPRNESLDNFLYAHLHNDSKYTKLFKVVKMILIMSHGQASVERGFSINKNMEVENLKESGYIARRLVYDYIKSSGDICDINISNEMRRDVSLARKKYNDYLEDQKAAKNSESVCRKRKLLEEELEGLKKKKAFLLQQVKINEENSDKLAEEAEAGNDIHLFKKSNSLRKSVKEQKRSLQQVEEEISSKRLELKNV